MHDELKNTLQKFIEAFEQVFDADWDYTMLQLGIPIDNPEDPRDSVYDYVSPYGTFLHPKVQNEFEDWSWRGTLLEEYRKAKELLSKS